LFFSVYPNVISLLKKKADFEKKSAKYLIIVN